MQILFNTLMNLPDLLNLQAAFYIVAIIAMVLHSLFLLIIVILLLAIKRKIANTIIALEKKFDFMRTVVTHPKETASIVGGAVAEAAINQAAKLFKKDKED